MAKTHKKETVEERERKSESTAHKRRREEKEKFRTLLLDPSFKEYADDEFESYEPIKRKSNQR